MKTLPSLILLFLASGILLAGDQAYTAVKVIRNERGDELLARLVEMKGARGGPQPDSWTLLFNDPEARGGVREIVVATGSILSERTPLSGFSGVGELPVIPISRLGIDSDGAFQIVNRRASQAGLGFHWIDYTLRMDEEKNMPIWVVDLVDYQGISVGTMTLSAENGSVVSALRVFEDGSPEKTTAPTSTPRGGAIGRVEETAKRTSDSVRRGTLRIIGNVEEWLTGNRTVDPHE
jgi:hypothetical protein